MSTGTTLAFPHSLREDIEAGKANHVSFQIMGAGLDENVFKIHMYIPQSIAVSDGASFGNLNTGIFNEAKAVIEASDKPKAEATDASLQNIGIGTAVIKQLGLDNFGVTDKALLDSGVAKNDATTLTYEGSAIRTFEFAFKMVASSAEESETMRIIEHTFRKYMYALKVSEAFLQYPPLFRIKFMKGDKFNNHLPRIFDSYLTNMSTTFNDGGGNMFFASGAPSEMSMNLTFQEQKQLTRDDIYSRDNVNPNDIKQNITFPEVKTNSVSELRAMLKGDG